ncbi:multidrug effflux MFS transporter [Sphingomonas profundi]|uniref:multidrug effflux MFS transporter n=1 Tax=Alterirhizorhabdus profundi TaxID=2681549 RepID=UPI0012E7B2C0|nr:multidrug effflux MFS transporter [Sphingomonas profundi]
MMHAPLSPAAARPEFAIGFREFVGIVAALMAVNALGIDMMLPALPAMGHSLGIAEENQRQWIIAAYVLGFGSCQLVYGPLVDRFGRKPVLTISLTLSALACVAAAALAHDFTTVVAARLLQGMTAAGSRVLAVSIVRDRYSGRQMARVMSLSFIVFLAVPILAPSLGQLVMLVMPWPGIFYSLAAFAMAVVLWANLRLPETLRPQDRRPISPRSIMAATRMVLTTPMSIGYTVAATLLFGGLMGYINSAQQIFTDVFHEERLFTIAFAGCAAAMGFSSLLNSRIVERLGTRLVSHSALVAYVAITGVHALTAGRGHEDIWTFCAFQAATMATFSLASSNFNAMAMEPVGHIAGTAASVQGTISTLGGALLGILIGQAFDGSTAPVAIGLFLLGLIALAIVLLTERGRLFRPQHAAPIVAPLTPAD